ncbi:flagellar regulatory protein FliZ [Erwinia sp. OLTSP20]|uniref:flagella biosynthesis regulatory protein FliZ n=1 Tax=unclassified Erwinia TaxID=2622719 RepID=UPI000C1937AC|nr:MULTISPECIES: flagella biosynthesis regulatory protein FliZ [unclassified Erwinia]PIJ48344.1 flagellar regulatory protein FliZ [Erwinia sp. OAMSP11]PIJ68697.1 flagellar regulatory protein FliZ [Erwinia sp. OLSSP12]PIJ78845.1 flagellar regulatory protein FliZ [Erwinia sp. OLCASP19]PIJ79815.1 flagellar regulatory protein FliZ [Erwinia sp. OLMTSP26]PIJ81220.1 flagellar regulatory protein FliZ [Erwinia sp. OLMDSP33]
MRSQRKMRPLSRYLKDYKHGQTNCSHCGKVLDRMALVFRGQLINKEAIARMDQLIDEQVWLKLQTELTALCRFCSDIYCNTHSTYFDIMAFKQYLFEQTAMSHSTIREYVVRLRRLDDMLQAKNFPHENLHGVSWHACLENQLPDAGNNNYRIALRKYDQFLGWQNTYL